MRQIHKFDDDYILWDLGDFDIGRPMVDRDSFFKTPEDVLEYEAMIDAGHIGMPGYITSLRDVQIEANEHASKELIEKYGFTAL